MCLVLKYFFFFFLIYGQWAWSKDSLSDSVQSETSCFYLITDQAPSPIDYTEEDLAKFFATQNSDVPLEINEKSSPGEEISAHVLARMQMEQFLYGLLSDKEKRNVTRHIDLLSMKIAERISTELAQDQHSEPNPHALLRALTLGYQDTLEELKRSRTLKFKSAVYGIFGSAIATAISMGLNATLPSYILPFFGFAVGFYCGPLIQASMAPLMDSATGSIRQNSFQTEDSQEKLTNPLIISRLTNWWQNTQGYFPSQLQGTRGLAGGVKTRVMVSLNSVMNALRDLYREQRVIDQNGTGDYNRETATRLYQMNRHIVVMNLVDLFDFLLRFYPDYLSVMIDDSSDPNVQHINRVIRGFLDEGAFDKEFWNEIFVEVFIHLNLFQYRNGYQLKTAFILFVYKLIYPLYLNPEELENILNQARVFEGEYVIQGHEKK